MVADPVAVLLLDECPVPNWIATLMNESWQQTNQMIDYHSENQ